MKKSYWVIFLTALIATVAYAAGVKDDVFRVGLPGSTSDKVLEFGTQRKIRSNETNGLLEFTNDNALWQALGSGSGGGSGINLLSGENADFEAGTPPQAWTASGGSFVSETATALSGGQSGVFDASAIGQTLVSALIEIEDGFIGQNCQAVIFYRAPGIASGDYVLKVQDQASNDLIPALLFNPTNGIEVGQVGTSFPCPTTATDQMQLKIESAVADPAALSLDNAFLGTGRNTLQVSQTTLVAHAVYPATVGCNWARNGTGAAPFSAVAACPPINVKFSTQEVNTADNDLPDLPMSMLSKGTYQLIVKIPVSYNAGVAHTKTYFIHDTFTGGIPTADESCVDAHLSTATAGSHRQLICTKTITLPAAQPVTFSIHGSEDAAGTMFITNAASTLDFRLIKYPTETNEAITFETSGRYLQSQIVSTGGMLIANGAAPDGSLPNNSDASLINQGSLAAEITCSVGTAPTGLTCSGVNETSGFAFTPHTTGHWFVCADFNHRVTIGAPTGSLAETVFRLRETNLDGTVELQTGFDIDTSRYVYQGEAAVASPSRPIQNCSIFRFDSISKKRVELVYNQVVSGAGTTTNLLEAGALANGGSELSFTAFPINQGFPTPVFENFQASLNGKVGFASDNLPKKECLISYSDTENNSVSDDEGGCFQSSADIGTGQTQITFTPGFFQNKVSCSCDAFSNALASVGCVTGNIALTGVGVGGHFISNGASVGVAATVRCIGD